VTLPCGWTSLFPKQRVVVFVDGCFWHGCPVHSGPGRWLVGINGAVGEPSPRDLRSKNLRRMGAGRSQEPEFRRQKSTKGMKAGAGRQTGGTPVPLGIGGINLRLEMEDFKGGVET